MNNLSIWEKSYRATKAINRRDFKLAKGDRVNLSLFIYKNDSKFKDAMLAYIEKGVLVEC